MRALVHTSPRRPPARRPAGARPAGRHDAVLRLQRQVGNRQTAELLAAERPPAEAAKADPETRKSLAHAWVERRLAEQRGLGALLEVLQAAERRFAVEIKVELEAPGRFRLTYRASPEWLLYLRHLYPIGNTVSDVLIGAGALPVSYLSRWYRWASGQWGAGNVRYGPLTGAGFGSFMEADPVPNEEGSKPSATNDTWNILKKRKIPGSTSSYYVRGHLLNDNIGGPGDTWANLTPLTRSSNNNARQSHLHVVETEIKNKVEQGKVMGYRVEPIYGRWVWEMPRVVTNLLHYGLDRELGEVVAAEDHVPTGLLCTWWEYTPGWGYVPKIRYIRQWANRGADEYKIGDRTFGTPDVWDVLQFAVHAALAALLLPHIPALASVAASYLPTVAASLLKAVALESGVTVAQFVFGHHYALDVLAGLVVAALSSGKVRWPRELVGILNL